MSRIELSQTAKKLKRVYQAPSSKHNVNIQKVFVQLLCPTLNVFTLRSGFVQNTPDRKMIFKLTHEWELLRAGFVY